MTTQELIDYYADLLILQYKNKPKAYAQVQAFVLPTIMDQLPFAVQDAFNIDTAIGVQLDVLGKYAGVSRLVNTFSGQVLLDDDDFRIIIKMKLVQNNSGSSLFDIQALLNRFFPGTLQVFDYANMQMSYYFSADLGSVQLAEAFVKQNLLPKPMGVQLGSLVYVTDLTNIFGFRTYTLQPAFISGFNSYSVYDLTTTWLSYTDAISI